MVRSLLAAAALCAASAVSAAVDVNADDGFSGATFTEGQLAPEGLEQDFYPASTATSLGVTRDVPLRLNLDDYVVIFKGERPSSFPTSRGYEFGEGNIDNGGLTLDQSYLLSTVSSSIDDQVRGQGFACFDMIPGFRDADTLRLMQYDGVYFRD